MTAARPSATRRPDRSQIRGIVKTLWLVNGQATGVDPADRGLAYGDGLFETMAAIDGQSLGNGFDGLKPTGIGERPVSIT